jgi:hypothetical protein
MRNDKHLAAPLMPRNRKKIVQTACRPKLRLPDRAYGYSALASAQVSLRGWITNRGQGNAIVLGQGVKNSQPSRPKCVKA